MLRAAIIGTLVGTLGTGLGAVVGVFFKKSRRWVGAGMAYAAGVMIAVSCLELLPEAFAQGGARAFWGFLGGTVFMFLAGLFLGEDGDELHNAGMLTLLAIAVHNFPEGLAIGSVMNVGGAASIIVTILLHDVPEGMAIGIPLRAGGKSFLAVLAYALMSGLPTGIGALLGSMMGASELALCICLAFAAGAMVAVSVNGLLPVSRSMAGNAFVLALMLGVLSGALAIKLTG